MPPAQLALATLLQAYTQVSDDEVIEATTMDRRWQLVLDCLDCDTPPFSKGTLVAFRQRLIAQQMDRRLLERTVEIAATSGAFGSRQLRAALDSSPLWGAGRVEDTYNLLGHALRKALGVIARQQGRGLRAVAEEAGPPWWRDRASKRPWIWTGTIPRCAAARADDDSRCPECRGTLARYPARPRRACPGSPPVWRWRSRCAPKTSPRPRWHPDPAPRRRRRAAY